MDNALAMQESKATGYLANEYPAVKLRDKLMSVHK